MCVTIARYLFIVCFLVIVSFLSRFPICLIIEVVEEVVEEDGVRESEGDAPARVAAIVEE